jgi:predicted kinase
VNLIIFIGLQATGKSSFYRKQFYRTHIRLNRDMLRTRHREALLFAACIEGKASVVIDNTNLTRAERAVFIGQARAAHFSVHGYFFQSRTADALARNAARSESERVPDLAIRGAARRLELPTAEEGFDERFFVRMDTNQQFTVEKWIDEV